MRCSRSLCSTKLRLCEHCKHSSCSTYDPIVSSSTPYHAYLLRRMIFICLASNALKSGAGYRRLLPLAYLPPCRAAVLPFAGLKCPETSVVRVLPDHAAPDLTTACPPLDYTPARYG